MFAAAALGQTQFQTHQVAQSTNPTPPLAVAAHGDFNNDGREDLVISGSTPMLYLSNGDGTYDPPRALAAVPVAIGDFNQDGKLDYVAVAVVSGVPQTRVYLGNGDGTFQAPKSFSDGSSTETISSVVAEDVNHDNKTDIVELYQGSTSNSLQIWISNGNGTFTKGQRISNVLSGEFGSQAWGGDFDGDGKADIALVNTSPGYGPTTVQVWYGDGAGHLSSPYNIADPQGDVDVVSPSAGDINNDGRNDLVAYRFKWGVGGTSTYYNEVAVFQGNSNRTLSFLALPTSQVPFGAIAVADVNGDGVNDLIYNGATPYTGQGGGFTGSQNLTVKLGQGNGNFGSEQVVYQNGNNFQGLDLAAIRSSQGTRPDLVFTQDLGNYNPGGSPTAVMLLSNETTGSFPGCGAPNAAEGIHTCTPGATASSPVSFSIAAAGPTPMRTAQVWVDGKKMAEQLTHAFSNYSFLDASLPLAAGSHSVTLFGVGWDGTLQKKSFTLQVASGGACSAPGSAGVHVCSPASGSTVSSPVQISAAGKVTGTFARFEVWADGVKKFTSTTTDGANISLSFASGAHTLTFFAVNTSGTKWEVKEPFTVK
jgi:hypothetical protein